MLDETKTINTKNKISKLFEYLTDMESIVNFLSSYSNISTVISLVAFFVACGFLYVIVVNRNRLKDIGNISGLLSDDNNKLKVITALAEVFPMDRDLTQEQSFETIKEVLKNKDKQHRRTINLGLIVVAICAFLIFTLMLLNKNNTPTLPPTNLTGDAPSNPIHPYFTDIQDTEINIPKSVLDELAKFNVDAITIMKDKANPTPDLCINSAYQKFIVIGKNLQIEHIVEGFNCSSKMVRSISFIGAGATPTTVENMAINATDLLKNTSLTVDVKDKPDNVAKRMEVFFPEPLKNNSLFKIQLNFTLKNTMYEFGPDYIVASNAYVNKVDKFKIDVEFMERPPTFIKANNLNNYNQSKVLEPRKKKYSYELSEPENSYLNKVWVVFTYDRDK